MSFEKNLTTEQNKVKFQNNKLFKWWRKNDYKVWRVVLFPIWICVYVYDKYKDYRYKSLTFSEEYCKKCIDKILPKLVAYYNEDPKCILISNCNDYGYIMFEDLCGIFSNYAEKHGCKKEIRFTSKFSDLTKKYIIEEHEIDGYNKMVLTNYKEWSDAAKKFDWCGLPYNCGNYVGVVFYQEV